MIALPSGTRIWIAVGVTDMRKGIMGLSAKVQTVLEQNPFTGHVFVFRGQRGDLIKVLWWDGDGSCLFAKRLEQGRFVWPQADSGTLVLSRAQGFVNLRSSDRIEGDWTPVYQAAVTHSQDAKERARNAWW